MFTSRAEYRLMLREDNADLRLTETGRELGLVDDERWMAFSAKRDALERERQRLAATWLRPSEVPPSDQQRVFGQPLSRESTLMDLLRRPEVRYRDLMSLEGVGPGESDPAVVEQLEVGARYAGYIERQQQEIERLRRSEETVLPEDIDYDNVHGLSAEIRQKLADHRPATIGQASRISGVTPAAVSLLLVHLKKRVA
jgi:tRNA uridine 5-carboxymethylaminomethyl modification enzyme